jgi:ribose/xylose/arabinose/galactoside ABC-type transport system permease subunit
MLIPGQQIRVGEYKEFFEPMLSWLPFGANSFPIVLISLFALGFSILMNRTRFGRYIYAIGCNEQTAIASGVPVILAKIKTYALSGFMCGIGAIAYLFRNISAAPGSTADYLLLSIASTMIGGISMYGGMGSVGGIVLGIISLASINSVLIVAGIPPALHKAVLGGIVLFSASFQWLSKRKA